MASGIRRFLQIPDRETWEFATKSPSARVRNRQYADISSLLWENRPDLQKTYRNLPGTGEEGVFLTSGKSKEMRSPYELENRKTKRAETGEKSEIIGVSIMPRSFRS